MALGSHELDFSLEPVYQSSVGSALRDPDNDYDPSVRRSEKPNDQQGVFTHDIFLDDVGPNGRILID